MGALLGQPGSEAAVQAWAHETSKARIGLGIQAAGGHLEKAEELWLASAQALAMSVAEYSLTDTARVSLKNLRSSTACHGLEHVGACWGARGIPVHRPPTASAEVGSTWLGLG